MATHGRRGQTWNARWKGSVPGQTGRRLCMAARNTRIRAIGQVVSHVFRVPGDNGGPLLGGTALKGWSALGKLGTLCLPLAQGTGPPRRGALSVRGAPPSPPKSPASVVARLGRCPEESRALISSLFFIFHFPFSIPLLSPPHPAFASLVKLAAALSPCSGSKSISCPGLSPLEVLRVVSSNNPNSTRPGRVPRQLYATQPAS